MDYRAHELRAHRLQAECYRAHAEAQRLLGRPPAIVRSTEELAAAYDRMGDRLEAVLAVDARHRAEALSSAKAPGGPA